MPQEDPDIRKGGGVEKRKGWKGEPNLSRVNFDLYIVDRDKEEKTAYS